MKAIKLTTDDYKRSLKARNMNHLWLYRKFDTTQRTHNNSVFLTRTIGEPFACLVVEYDRALCDEDIEKIFGKGAFYNGGVSPEDKQFMDVDAFYLTK